tara:strand:- start:345 stop:656 length:312 start_codon:yes stop_codon:yes gene_type:complete
MNFEFGIYESIIDTFSSTAKATGFKFVQQQTVCHGRVLYIEFYRDDILRLKWGSQGNNIEGFYVTYGGRHVWTWTSHDPFGEVEADPDLDSLCKAICMIKGAA